MPAGKNEIDWKGVAERLYCGFFGRCWFTERFMSNASLNGTRYGVWTVDGHRQSDGNTFYAIVVENRSELGECYKNHVENFCSGLYFDGNGRRTPKIEWSSDAELLLKLSALGMAVVNNGDEDSGRKRARRGAGERADGGRDRRGGGRPLQGRPS